VIQGFRFDFGRGGIVDGMIGVSEGIAAAFRRLLPGQRKTQRQNLALLIATMLGVRSANLMDLAAGLPRDVARIDMRFQWIWRVLMNPLIDPDAIMAPFAREVMERQAHAGQPIVLIMDQSKLSDRHHVLMLALRQGERALPVLWRVEATEGAIGFDVQKTLLVSRTRSSPLFATWSVANFWFKRDTSNFMIPVWF